MQNVSETYRRLLADPEHTKQVKVDIAGTEYGEDRITALSISGGMFPDLVVGNCFAREIDLTVEADGQVPRMARIAVYVRLAAGEEASEWLPGGVFFTDTRTLDREVGLLNIHGFDAMLKAEQVWLDPSLDAGEWPMTQAAAAADIARRLGAELDPRTAIEPGAKVEYPNDLSMREVLGYIAMCHGGNWAVTDGGRLLLTPLGGVPKETNYLVEDTWGGAILFGEVRIIV